jgi:hypothetical protein
METAARVHRFKGLCNLIIRASARVARAPNGVKINKAQPEGIQSARLPALDATETAQSGHISPALWKVVWHTPIVID